MLKTCKVEGSLKILQDGGVIAYPTEAVYGLGCDPFNEQAVKKILKIKHRSVDKGLILIASSWEQIQDLTQSIPNKTLQKALDSWPGPYTWIFPASNKAPKWITGKYDSIALRITNHPIARKICEQFGAIVSTSANIERQEPAKTAAEVKQQFPTEIDYIVSGDVGDLRQPTIIQNILSNDVVRN